MNGLAFGTAFAGAAILLWAVRALRSRVVTFGKLRLYGRWSVWIFGFVSTICGFLMALTGAAALLYMNEGFADILAKSGLVLFAIAWLLAIVFECCYRIGWRLYPSYAPLELRQRQQAAKRKRKGRGGSSGEDDAHARSRGRTSLRRLKTLADLIVTAGSQQFHKRMTPSRSWDKQGLWNVDTHAEPDEVEKPKLIDQSDPGKLDLESLDRESGNAKSACH